MNHELLDSLSRDVTEFAQALDSMRAYAHADDGLTADKFGPIARKTGVGQNYTQLRDILRGALDKAAPFVDGTAQALADARKLTSQTEADVVADIEKAADGHRFTRG